MRGEVGKEDGVLVIRRVHVSYELRTGEENRETVDRVHAVHHGHCPVYRTLERAFRITTDYEILTDEPQ